MTDLPYDYTSWQFLDAIGQASPLQQELQPEEAMSLAFEFPSHGRGESDFALLSSDNCLPYGQTSAKAAPATGFMQTQTHTPPIDMGLGIDIDMDMETFAQGMDFISVPPFPDLTLGHGKKTPDRLSLLRSTSQNATERALFMTPSGITSPSSSSFSSTSSSSSSNRNSSSPSLDPCTPSTTSTTSKESDEDWDWDCDRELDPSLGMHFYKLPDRLDAFQSIPHPPRHVHPPPPHHYPHPQTHRVNNKNTHQEEDEADALTPLEMPDGSTRFTANWLPVDPTGGFTIDSPSVSASASAMEFGYPSGHGYGHPDHAYGYGYGDPISMEFSKEAFIQMPAPV